MALLLLDNLSSRVAHSIHIFFPEGIDSVAWPKDVGYGTVPRPRYDVEAGLVNLANEVWVFVEAQPIEEITDVTVSVVITAALGTVGLAVEAVAGYAHSISRSFYKFPHSFVRASVRTYALRLKLEGMG